ncbi:AP-4 complex subunit beta-1-like [Xenia sp. Carnegie-2017]|uniref:AP-4 complex subunit beta-1-like n=1 Tax=Xenia sp. Carnegie-2017 TaxID=2897299 RepID=UPI001F046528|nr:AP-4 complex subunit beta-1-like [Xenia sp. Carnegie-2017]XP_046860505.1 AP-4 complex subunit beta-1-like [Xenia sp. Carnegie-2017]
MSGLCSYKDEVTELREKLNVDGRQRNSEKYVELLQQVIFYMTKGIDMTSLFPVIVKAAATKDLIQKKLCYLYICHYARYHSDLALLAVNTLVRDAQDTDFMVRGLALRSIGSLSLASLVEYTKDVVMKGLEDHSTYVRKTAVIGCLQLYQVAPQEFNEEELVLLLNKRFLEDKDMKVRCNAIYVLEEMLSEKSARFHQFILKSLSGLDEWGLMFALDILKRHYPEKEEDIYSTLNRLDVCLKHVNTSIVLAAVRLFLLYTSKLPVLRNDVFKRIKVPLLTALLSKSSEIAYSVACHIQVILHHCPLLFQDNVSSFYCKRNDPVYLKIKKLEILSNLVTESNGKEILEELRYHAEHNDTSSFSIQSISKIAILHPDLADKSFELLLSLVKSRDHHIVSRALAALRNFMVPYDLESQFVGNISRYLQFDLLPDGKASVIWMLGEYGEKIPEAPYVLETMSEQMELETSHVVKLELLTACMKLFFKRPPECQAILAYVLYYCTVEECNMDVRDRALMYYRLLELDVNKAKEVVCPPRNAQINVTSNIFELEYKETMLDEFNTLSVLYGGHLMKKVHRKIATLRKREMSEEDDTKKNESEANTVTPVMGDASLLQLDDDAKVAERISEDVNESSTFKEERTSNEGSVKEIVVEHRGDQNQLLLQDPEPSFQAFLCDPQLTPQVSFQDPEPSCLVLLRDPELSPQQFETLWSQLPESESYEMQLDEIPDQDEFLRKLNDNHILTMASTPLGVEEIRYFLYAKAECFILCEVCMYCTTLEMKCIIKMEDSKNVHSFIEIFQDCLDLRTK